MAHPFVTGKFCNFADCLTRPVTVAAQEDDPVSRMKRDFQGDCLADRACCTGDQSQTMIMILIGLAHGIPDVYGKFNSDTILTGVPESVRPTDWLSYLA